LVDESRGGLVPAEILSTVTVEVPATSGDRRSTLGIRAGVGEGTGHANSTGSSYREPGGRVRARVDTTIISAGADAEQDDSCCSKQGD
jgi:hypothetical protein